MDYITDHGVELPDPAVCFDDIGYEVNNNDHPRIYEGFCKAMRELDIKLFTHQLDRLYNNLKPTVTLQDQLKAAISGFYRKIQAMDVKYKGPKDFSELGYFAKSIDINPLYRLVEREIDEVRNLAPIRQNRIQDRILKLGYLHPIYEKLTKLYDKLGILEKPYSITDINLHISDPKDTFNEYFQTDQKHKPKNKLYTLHIDPKYGYIKTIIYLSEVKKENGPFAYIPYSHRWKFDDVEMLFCKSNQLSNTLSTVKDRFVNAGLPLWARKNAYFSRQFKDDDPMSEKVYSQLKHFTSDETNFILFEPNHGWHRGTHVEEGERIALQVIMKPNDK